MKERTEGDEKGGGEEQGQRREGKWRREGAGWLVSRRRGGEVRPGPLEEVEQRRVDLVTQTQGRRMGGPN